MKTLPLPTNGHTPNGQSGAPSGSRPEKTPLIPPHVAWPLFVVALLLMSVGAAVVTVIAANSDGGVQIIEGSPYDPGRHDAD